MHCFARSCWSFYSCLLQSLFISLQKKAVMNKSGSGYQPILQVQSQQLRQISVRGNQRKQQCIFGPKRLQEHDFKRDDLAQEWRFGQVTACTSHLLVCSLDELSDTCNHMSTNVTKILKNEFLVHELVMASSEFMQAIPKIQTLTDNAVRALTRGGAPNQQVCLRRPPTRTVRPDAETSPGNASAGAADRSKRLTISGTISAPSTRC